MAKNTNKATLDRKSIDAIADQVEARINQQPKKAEAKKEDSSEDHGGGKKVFLLGAASGVAAAFVAAAFGRQARPAVRGAIKGGIVASRYVQRVASTIKEDVQDLSAEARADLDAENNPGAAI